MTQYGFYFDATNCIGCHVCQVACKDTHRLRAGVNYRTVTSWCTGRFPDVHQYHVSMGCNHCNDPACVTYGDGVFFRDPETGLVLVEDRRSCGRPELVEVCPYGAIAYDERTGFIGKCDGCVDLRRIGEQPACVASCPQRVLEFDDIDVLIARHAGETLARDCVVVPSADATEPNLVMRIKECMLDEDCDQMIL